MNSPSRRLSDSTKDRWHVGKEIPLALIIMMIFQTCGAIWWLANLSAKLDNVALQVQELKGERYTAKDAMRDQRVTDLKFEELTRRLGDVETGKADKP